MSDPVYVDKRHYDLLLRKHMTVLRELDELRDAWNKFKKKLSVIDPHTFDSAKDRGTLFDATINEQLEYISGSADTLIRLNDYYNKLEEERYHAPIGRKQTQV